MIFVLVGHVRQDQVALVRLTGNLILLRLAVSLHRLRIFCLKCEYILRRKNIDIAGNVLGGQSP